MSYTIENVNGCTKKIQFNFETLDLTTEIKAAVTAKQKTVSLKGFRKGKAPLAMVEKMYGPELESDALNRFVQNQYFETVKKEEMKVCGYPKFENMKYDPGKSVKFDAEVEVFPNVELKSYSSLSFEKEKVDISDEDVQKVINQNLESKAEMKEVEGGDVELKVGHHAVMSFEGTRADGSKPDNMKGDEFVLEIGSGQFIPGFEDGMIGMKTGDKKTIECNFPDDYHVEELKSEKVSFDVELKEIKEKILPDFTDEIAKELKSESVEDFKNKTKSNLEKQKNRDVMRNLHQEILEKLVAENDFDIPMTLVVQQENAIKKDLSQNLTQQGFNDSMLGEYFEKWKEDVQQKAVFQVRSGLIMEALAKKYNVETSDADFDQRLDEIATEAGISAEEVKKYYTSDSNIKSNLLYGIREEKTFSALIADLKITEK